MLVDYRLLHTDALLLTRPQTSPPTLDHLVEVTEGDGGRRLYRVVAVQWPLTLRRGEVYYSLSEEAEVVVQVYLVEVADEDGAP